MPIGLGVGALIGGAISGGGAIAGSAIASKGANKAAKTQSDAALQAAQLQKQAQDDALAFQKQQYGENVARQQPWLQAGQAALGKLSNFGAFQAPGAAGMAEDPGYQFRLAEGQKALQNSAAARGNLAGGGALKAAERYGQGMGSQEYQNVYARRMGEYNNQLGQLQSLAGVGQSTASGLGTAGANAAGQMGNILQQGATGQGNAMQNAAAARASGYADTSSIWGNLVKTGGGALSDLYKMRGGGGNIGYIPGGSIDITDPQWQGGGLE